jgi:hypothetical protein
MNHAPEASSLKTSYVQSQAWGDWLLNIILQANLDFWNELSILIFSFYNITKYGCNSLVIYGLFKSLSSITETNEFTQNPMKSHSEQKCILSQFLIWWNLWCNFKKQFLRFNKTFELRDFPQKPAGSPKATIKCRVKIWTPPPLFDPISILAEM